MIYQTIEELELLMSQDTKIYKNMLAGASGIDIVLLVVAADEGVMPQTVEHLDILSFLNIKME